MFNIETNLIQALINADVFLIECPDDIGCEYPGKYTQECKYKDQDAIDLFINPKFDKIQVCNKRSEKILKRTLNLLNGSDNVNLDNLIHMSFYLFIEFLKKHKLFKIIDSGTDKPADEDQTPWRIDIFLLGNTFVLADDHSVRVFQDVYGRNLPKRRRKYQSWPILRSMNFRPVPKNLNLAIA